jgi:hypothetical protein
MTALNECEGKTPSQKNQVLHPSHTSSFPSTYHHLPRPFVRILTISKFLHTLYLIRRIYNHLIAKRIALVKDEFKSKEQETVVLLNPISNLRVLFVPSLAFACLQTNFKSLYPTSNHALILKSTRTTPPVFIPFKHSTRTLHAYTCTHTRAFARLCTSSYIHAHLSYVLHHHYSLI